MRKAKAFLLCGAGLAAAAVSENIISRHEAACYPAPGKMVDVGGKKMHVMEYGDGNQTIVFLPGLGTAVPCADFAELANELSEFRCILPEPFGYGWSDTTDSPRTVENIVEEVREGLLAAGIKPPYILLGHSVAGLYVRWWACRYPEEVSGIIGDDNSVPEQIKQQELTRWFPDRGITHFGVEVLSALSPFGLGRAVVSVSGVAKRLCGRSLSMHKAVKARAVRCWFGRPIVSEFENFKRNANAADMLFPSCPILIFAANGPKSAGNMAFKSGFSWVGEHEKYAAEATRGKCVVLHGEHYLHRSFYETMAREITCFFAE